MNRCGSVIRIGTRRSLLALAQSGRVARDLEAANPGVKVELVGIDTRGDRIQDVPLGQVEGKEFFVAELDEALRSGRVDLCVHSMKDLSLDRPSGFVCTALPRRENPRDVVLFGPRVPELLRAGNRIKIGTSSPRRLENIPTFLSTVIPGRSELEFVEIRGNVNTRLARVHEPAGSSRGLDAVVLAFAGLIRLWNDPNARKELERLLRGVRWMVLPLAQCPAAPGQGALALECRHDDFETRERAGKLHDVATAEEVELERSLLRQWGGGCHQRFGATCVRSEGLGKVMFVRGRRPSGEFVEELRWAAPPPVEGDRRPWDGSGVHAKKQNVSPLVGSSFKGRAVYVSHDRALDDDASAALSESRVWVPGVRTWVKLAARGVWVEGCAEGWGFDSLSGTIEERVLQLPPQQEWMNITHADAERQIMQNAMSPQMITTYRSELEITEQERDALRKATHIYWTSASQFDQLGAVAAPLARHACGPGRTARALQSKGVSPDLFPSVEEWRKWVKT